MTCRLPTNYNMEIYKRDHNIFPAMAAALPIITYIPAPNIKPTPYITAEKED